MRVWKQLFGGALALFAAAAWAAEPPLEAGCESLLPPRNSHIPAWFHESGAALPVAGSSGTPRAERS